jgi:hypothetical protein
MFTIKEAEKKLGRKLNAAEKRHLKQSAKAEKDVERMEAITEGTNMEGLTPDQAYDLDQRIMDAVGCAASFGVPHERFLELCDAARDVVGFRDRHPKWPQRS